jgi:hypothetical protein
MLDGEWDEMGVCWMGNERRWEYAGWGMGGDWCMLDGEV